VRKYFIPHIANATIYRDGSFYLETPHYALSGSSGDRDNGNSALLLPGNTCIKLTKVVNKQDIKQILLNTNFPLESSKLF
jgi:hypothetical protein